MFPVSYIKPLVIKPSMITSSTAVKKLAGEAEWVAATAYALGQVVTRADLGGRRFENLIAGQNTNKPEDDRDRWYDLGLTDQNTMFDGKDGRQSIAPNALTVVLRPGAHNALFLAGLDGTALDIVWKEYPGGPQYHSYSGTLEDTQPDDYYDYYFAPYSPQTDFLITDVTPYASCEVTITISNPGSVARCAIASIGDLTAVGGPALSGVSVDVSGSARVTADDRGMASVVAGKLACDLSAQAIVPDDMARGVVRSIRAVQNIPCPWLITDQRLREELRSFGLGAVKLTYTSNQIRASIDVQGTI
ncbi:hypothetical protein [uncultured Massilia sp.]|uniref:hypothetical protein n=1 Tax=uncultured Massilia sp. TaxID=169973 RepID=UPI0025865BAA|nr:hypothetical protein [uncultured Massilia sp.]